MQAGRQAVKELRRQILEINPAFNVYEHDPQISSSHPHHHNRVCVCVSSPASAKALETLLDVCQDPQPAKMFIWWIIYVIAIAGAFRLRLSHSQSTMRMWMWMCGAKRDRHSPTTICGVRRSQPEYVLRALHEDVRLLQLLVILLASNHHFVCSSAPPEPDAYAAHGCWNSIHCTSIFLCSHDCLFRVFTPKHHPLGHPHSSYSSNSSSSSNGPGCVVILATKVNVSISIHYIGRACCCRCCCFCENSNYNHTDWVKKGTQNLWSSLVSPPPPSTRLLLLWSFIPIYIHLYGSRINIHVGVIPFNSNCFVSARVCVCVAGATEAAKHLSEH